MMSYLAMQDVIRARARIQRTACDLLDCWSSFVKECEEGYSWDISEYRNEIGVRDQLGEILNAPELETFEEHQQLKDRVESIDKDFRKLLMPGCVFPGESKWYRQGVLRFAGHEYAGYCRVVYGFKVKAKDD